MPIPGLSAPTHPGLLLTVEGIDGAGKSTVLQKVAAYLREVGIPTVVSREPTQGPWGRKLRESATKGRLPLEEELDLFCRDREEHVKTVIRPGLEAGAVVLLDRYYLSTAAYQGARGADPAAILRRNEEFAPAPDLILLLDLSPRSGLARVRSRGDAPDAFEKEEELQRAREVFLSHAGSRAVRIDANQGPEAVAGECIDRVRCFLQGKGWAAANAHSGEGSRTSTR